MMGENDRLPALFQRVDWVASNNSSAYIEMGLTFFNEMDLDFVATSNARTLYGFGKNAGNYFGVGTDGCYELGGSVKIAESNGHTRGILHISLTGNQITISHNGVSVSRSGNTGGNWCLFTATRGASLWGSSKVYGAIVKSGNLIVRNYIPCYRKSDNVGGLYDFINKSFTPSTGYANLDYGND